MKPLPHRAENPSTDHQNGLTAAIAIVVIAASLLSFYVLWAKCVCAWPFH